MKMKRFLSLLLAGTLALALTACGGSAKTDPGTSDQPSTSDENWTPKENVTMIVSYKAGSGTDNTARVLAAYAEKYIGKPVIIENLEGGSGSIGWTALSQAAPDGYTLGFINLPNFNATISEGLATYTVDSFAPICNHVTETSVVLVKADSQFNTLEDLVKFAKDNPGKLKASTNGNRASNHIGAQVLATSAGFEYTDIPYGGTADQLLALRQGEVDFSVAKVADFASFTSEVKVLAVYNQERLEGYPDVPTMGELGYYDQWLGSSRCIVAPAGTPENVIKFYEDAFQKLMEDADYHQDGCEVVLFFGEERETVLAICRKWADQSSIYCFCGSERTTFPQVAACYQVLCEMRRQKFWAVDRHCWLEEDFTPRRPHSSFTEQMSAELASALRGSDLEQIQRLWQQIQDSIREDRFQDQLFVFQRIVSLMEKQLPALKPLVSDNFWATLKDIQTLDAIFSDAFRKIVQNNRELHRQHIDQLASQVVRQIEQSYADSDLSPTRIADSLGMSSAYLGRIFRESTQTSISQYLNQTRIRRAEELLRETEQPVETVAGLVGFSNPKYFYVVFKNITGQTPLQFRKAVHSASEKN